MNPEKSTAAERAAESRPSRLRSGERVGARLRRLHSANVSGLGE
jgi:hypothetical protein